MSPSSCFFVCLVALAQAKDDESQLKEILYPFYAMQAARYNFYLDTEHKKRLELQSQPVLTWTNVDHYMGSVFIWSYAGRPELIGCIGSHQGDGGVCSIFNEFHSLCPGTLQPVMVGSREWILKGPGIQLKEIEGAPEPSESEPLRLTQMRNIARDFQGTMKDGEDVTELRLLPRPIHRYKSAEQGVIDGAIFAMVWKGTDPEILLVLEDHKENASTQWKYGLARFNYREMWVRLKDREIWRAKTPAATDNYVTASVERVTLDQVRSEIAPAKSQKP